MNISALALFAQLAGTLSHDSGGAGRVGEETYVWGRRGAGRGSGLRLTKHEGVRPTTNISAPALIAQLAGILSHDSGGSRAGGRRKLSVGRQARSAGRGSGP